MAPFSNSYRAGIHLDCFLVGRKVFALQSGGHILLLGCHWLPSLKMGFLFFSSGEKLQFVRNIACIRLNNNAAAVWLARLEHRHNNLIDGSTRRRATWKNSCGRHSSLCFSFVEFLSFRAVKSIYSRITFLVAMLAVRGCA